MDPERWQKIEHLYHSALKQEPTRRHDFLSDACRSDLDLRREVESLLAQSGSTEALVCESASAAADELISTSTMLNPGQSLGPYSIVALLGTGGMGEVYVAEDTRLGRKVAIKISQERFSGRFQHEARAISALNHPNICTLYDIGPNYLVTELVEGETLRDLLTRGPATENALPIATQVLDALRAAHHAGIVHRDLKPQNIMVRRDGYVKVLDFGLATRMTTPAIIHSQETATLATTVSQHLYGTAAYMSPEQILGKEVDQRSDLFAFGIILYEMVAGRHPWPRTSVIDTLHAILHEEPPPLSPPSAISAEIIPIVEKLLCKNPFERYGLAEAVLEALAGCAVSAAPRIESKANQKPLTSVAVLPFVFLHDPLARNPLSLGFADALITVLSSLEDVAVVPTSSILNYPPGAEPLATSRDLGVRHVLQGSVQNIGKQWRVSTQLFDSITQKIALAEIHDFVMENIFEVQDEIGRRVVQSLRSRFPQAMPKSRERYSSNPEAYNAFIAGLRDSYSDRQEILQSGAQSLSMAVELDPEFALAHAILSYASMQINFEFDPQRSWLEKAEHHCGRALTLDPALPEAHLARAFILWSPAKNFQHAEALAELERVLAVQPNLERAHNRVSSICLHIGKLQEALLAYERTRRCNPKTRSNTLEFFYLYTGDFARAEQAAENWIKEKPTGLYARWFHPQPPMMIGDLSVAEERLTAALNLVPEDPLVISLQGMLQAKRGQSELALQSVRRALETPHSFGHTHHTYYQLACVYAILEQKQRAMAWLERAVEAGFPCWPFFQIDPHLESLREQPGFMQLVADLEQKYSAINVQRL